MSALNPMFLISLGLTALVSAAILTVAVLRILRTRARARRRVREQPNSHYTSQLVRQRETRHRWHNMALDRIHDINREEVVRLLARVDATSVDALRPNERAFLDHMAGLAGTAPPAEPREEKNAAVAPDLRHRPA